MLAALRRLLELFPVPEVLYPGKYFYYSGDISADKQKMAVAFYPFSAVPFGPHIVFYGYNFCPGLRDYQVRHDERIFPGEYLRRAFRHYFRVPYPS